MSVLIKDAWVVTQNTRREIIKADVYIEDNLIAEVGKINVEADYVFKEKDMIVIPGLINTHTHVGMTDLRGLVDDVSLHEFLTRTFEIDSHRTPEDIKKGAELGIKEMLRTGTTTFFDFYYSEDVIASMAEKYGIRAYLGWAVLDEEHTTQKGNPLQNAERFLQEYGDKDLVKPAVAPHGVYVCSEETCLKAKELAEKYDAMLTMHISETREEVYNHRKKTGMRPVEWLVKIGFLNSRLLAVHCVWLTLNEIKLLRENGVKVSHNPTSNMKLGNGGSMPLPELIKENIPVTLGTDSAVSNNNLDMFEVMKFAALLHKNERWDASITTAQQIFDMTTVVAADALGLKAGRIVENYLADVVIINGAEPNAQPLRKETIISNLVYSLNGLNVMATIVNGRIVYDMGNYPET